MATQLTDVVRVTFWTRRKWGVGHLELLALLSVFRRGLLPPPLTHTPHPWKDLRMRQSLYTMEGNMVKRRLPLTVGQRHQKGRMYVITQLGGKCWGCGASDLPHTLLVYPREGMQIPIPEGGRFLRTPEKLMKQVVPYAMLVCHGCQPKGEKAK